MFERPVERPELFYAVSTAGFAVVEKPLSTWEKLYENGAVRKTVLLLVLAAAWELYARWLEQSAAVPTFSATVGALFDRLHPERSRGRPSTRLSMLLKGYVAGLASRHC